MNQRKAKQIRKTALSLIQAQPEKFKDSLIPRKNKLGWITTPQRISGFRTAKRAAAAIY